MKLSDTIPSNFPPSPPQADVLSKLPEPDAAHDNRPMPDSTTRVGDVRGRALIVRSRAAAALQLITSGSGDECEARRASAQYLRLNVEVCGPQPLAPAPEPALSEADVRAALERLCTGPVEVKGP